MRVTVVDRRGQPGGWGFTLRTVTIADHCPVCRGPRGVPVLRQFCEEGEFYSVHCWENTCGHRDLYPAVLAEAEGNCYAARV